MLLFLSLDQVYIAEHVLISELLCKDLRHECIQVEPSKSNKLPAVTKLCKGRDEFLNLLVWQPRRLPVKRRRQIVRKHQIRVFCKNSLSKLSSNVKVWSRRLHPEHVCKLSKFEPSFDAILNVSFNPVKSFLRSAGFPVKFEVKA